MSTQNVDRQLHMRLFGAPQIQRGAVSLTFARRSSLALLAYLAVTGEPQSRASLMALLAGDAPPGRASAYLRNALADLNHHVGDCLHVTRQVVAFKADGPYWLDVQVFETALAEAKVRPNLRLLQTFSELYSGEFMAGFSLRDAPEFEQWLLLERERWRQRAVEALYLLLTCTLDQGDRAAGIDVAQRLLQLDPWHELTHQRLMLLLAQSGRRAEALAHYKAYQERLAADFQTPPLEATQALYTRLRAESVAPPHNLPPSPTSFIGRVSELNVLIEQLAEPTCRLITIVGLPGAGKTRLALQAASYYVTAAHAGGHPPFADGIYMVDMASVLPAPARDGNVVGATGRAIAATITATIGLTLTGAPDPTIPLLSYLHSKRVLLVLDNFEHLLDGARLLADILAYAPQVKLLVTSRVRLNIAEEWTLRLGGLSLPHSAADVEQSEGGRLFLQQARQAHLNTPLSEADYPAIVRLCQLTDGLPLALVLAAGWLPTLSCAALADELAANLNLLLAQGERAGRHTSLQAVLEWSWRHLTNHQQQALRRLTIFREGFDHDAAQAVASVDLRMLRALQDTSLLTISPSGRYQLHELIRQFALRRLLAQAQEAAAIRATHAAYYGAFIQRTVSTPQAGGTLSAIQAEIQNVRAAWEWAMDHSDVRLLTQLREGLAVWYAATGQQAEGQAVLDPSVAWLRVALEVGPDANRQAALGRRLVDQAALLIQQRRYTHALSLLDEAQVVARLVDNHELAAWIAFRRAQVAWNQGDFPTAQALFEQALSRAANGDKPVYVPTNP